MNNNIGEKKFLKRKISDNQPTSTNNDIKRKFQGCSQETYGRRLPSSQETNLFKESVVDNPPVQNRLKNFSINNRLHSQNRKIANNKSPREWCGSDSAFDYEGGTNYTQTKLKQCIAVTSNTSGNRTLKTNKQYSANNRLKDLRSKLINNRPQNQSFPIDVPITSVSNPHFQIQSKTSFFNDEAAQKGPSNSSQSSNWFTDNLRAISSSSLPFKDISKGQKNTYGSSYVSEVQPQTDYDDSDSAVEFGNGDSRMRFQWDVEGQCGSKPHLSLMRQQLDRQSAGPTFRLNSSEESIGNQAYNRQGLVNSLSKSKGTSPDSSYSNDNILSFNKSFSNEQQTLLNTQAQPYSFNSETNITKVQNSHLNQTRSKPYSANDRLKQIYSRPLLSNNKTDEFITESENVQTLNPNKSVPIISSATASNSLYPSISIISSPLLSPGSKNKSSYNEETSDSAKPSTLSQRLYNIRNSVLKRDSRKSFNCLPVDKREDNSPQIQQAFNMDNQSNSSFLYNKLCTMPGKERNQMQNPLAIPNSDEEPMDWSEIDEKETLSNLQTLRKAVLVAEEIVPVPQTPFQKVVSKASPEMQHNVTILRDIYVVVDTNIFISHLNIVKQVLNIKINGVETPIILIPWMVIQELDYIKEGRSGDRLKGRAQAAINFINHRLSIKDPFVKGQSVVDAAQQDFSSKNPDDGILHCCLQIIKKRNKATLLSNDVNLRNKALLHDIPAYGHDNIIQALDPYHCVDHKSAVNVEDDKIKELKTYLSHTCSFIILQLLKQDYGPIWEKLRPTSPPWSLQECIELFQKYWLPVFSMHLNKHFHKHVDDFGKYLKTKPDGIIPIEDGEKLIEFSLALCVYLKNGLPRFKSTVDTCINNIQNVVL